jgi:hypothetical protein
MHKLKKLLIEEKEKSEFKILVIKFIERIIDISTLIYSI